MNELRLAGTQVRAVSVGGLETSIDLPELKVAFDIGRCPPFVVARETILFTHAHMDHLGGIAYHAATRALRNLGPPTYVVPPEILDDLVELFAVWRRLDRSTMAAQFVPLGPGGRFRLRRGLEARPFRALHVAPCQGYALVSQRQKLRPEFVGLPSQELAHLRRSGQVLTTPQEVVEVAFCGDTRIEVVEREPAVRTARLLILEATFLDDRVTVAEARGMGHVHLDEIVERAELFENEAILLTHASPRYTRHEVAALLEKKLPPRLAERVTPLYSPSSSSPPDAPK